MGEFLNHLKMHLDLAKYHKFSAGALSALYVWVLYNWTTPVPIFRFLLPAFLCTLGITAYYNFKYLIAGQAKNIWPILRVALLQSAGFLLFFVMPSALARLMFLVMSFIFLYISEYLILDFSENILFNEVILISFGFFYGFNGLLWNFPSFNYLGIFGLFVVLSLLTRCFYEFAPLSQKEKWINALVLCFLSAQIFWACLYLPFHFSALAIIGFNLYYLLVALNYFYIFKTLTEKKFKFHVGLSAICMFLVLLATPWKIL
jgi:hypothetical protein